MTQKFTLHTHTIGFDGRSTPADMVARAHKLGCSTIGISNHFILRSDIRNAKFYPFAVARGYQNIYNDSFDQIINLFQEHYAQLDAIAEKSPVRVLRGLEVDFFDNSTWQHDFERAVKILRPDYIIGACHFVEYDGVLCNVHDIANADENARDEMLAQYWNKIQTATTSGLFTWMAHLDLPKKVGLGLGDKWADVEQKTIETISRHNVAIEINTGLESEPYPSKRILQHVAQHNIPVLFSDDAHHADQIGRRFDMAAQLCRDCGITNFYTPDCVK